MISSKLRLPFAARWGDQVLQPGEYEVIFMALGSAPVVAVHGGGVAAMMKPTRVNELCGTCLSTLFLRPTTTAPEVQFLRLAVAGLDLYFQKGRANTARRGVLALPVHESLDSQMLKRQRRYDC
jgi:hypothetical protein